MDQQQKRDAVASLRIPRPAEETYETSKRKASRLAWVGIAALLVIVLAALLWKRSPIPVEVTSAAAMAPSQADAILTASGYVVAQRKAAVASKGTGRLESLLVEEGDRVLSGQILARLEHADVEAVLAESRARAELAKSALVQARAELHESELTYGRLKALVGDSTIARADFDASEARYKRAAAAVRSAEAGIRAAEAGVALAEVQVENTNIRAPFDGTVLTKNADVGEIVAPFASSTSARGAVVSIADMGSLMVEVDVSESNVAKIRPGMPCEAMLDALPDRRYRAEVHKIIPTVDRAKATVLTRVRFLSPDDRILPDMSAKVVFLSRPAPEGEAARPRIVIRPAAVTDRGGRKVVFALRGDAVAETPVELGAEMGDMVEVRRGLAAGDRVVLHPPESLANGSRVRVKE
jgi:RND family efflux transporter MFP subunit